MGNMKQMLQRLRNRFGSFWNRLRRPAPGKIMYIGGADPLPPPLPRQEEAELLKRLDEKGYILSVPSNTDKRCKNIYLTEKAYDIQRRMENQRRKLDKMLTIGMNKK